MPDSPPVLEELTRSECLKLVEGGGVGRVGINVEALPAILPVDFGILDQDIVVRTVPGTRLDAALTGAVVAFQADFTDRSSGDAWSVLVRGVAHKLTTREDLCAAKTLGLRSWAIDDKEDCFVRIKGHNRDRAPRPLLVTYRGCRLDRLRSGG
jgi:nitroimidazol reductase NimA-like FMN-containing flavoprotein (pyridoxamine 5'-phosphate oxidase superfamily)